MNFRSRVTQTKKCLWNLIERVSKQLRTGQRKWRRVTQQKRRRRTEDASGPFLEAHLSGHFLDDPPHILQHNLHVAPQILSIFCDPHFDPHFPKKVTQTPIFSYPPYPPTKNAIFDQSLKNGKFNSGLRWDFFSCPP